MATTMKITIATIDRNSSLKTIPSKTTNPPTTNIRKKIQLSSISTNERKMTSGVTTPINAHPKTITITTKITIQPSNMRNRNILEEMATIMKIPAIVMTM